MSEYQYYEFRAIDRPLDERAMAALRALSSRAEITPTSLINVYHFGDFKGNPDRLMDEYFDAHLYVANWGTRRLMLRLPGRSFPVSAAEPYSVPDSLAVRATNQFVVLDFRSECEGGDDFDGGEGWLASLIALRSDLLAGDLRSAYLGWLAGVQAGEVDEATPEPPVPPGLGQLSAPLKRFIDFLRVDDELVEVASAASDKAPPTGQLSDELAKWVVGLPVDEKDELLVRLVQGEGGLLTGELLGRFRSDRARRKAPADRGTASPPPGRTVGTLLAARDRLAADKQRQAAEQAAREATRREREHAAARARHLDALVGRDEELWQQAEAAIGTKLPKQYDRAVELLKDLRDLAERTGTGEAVSRRIGELRQRHRAKPTLSRRLDQAGLPK